MARPERHKCLFCGAGFCADPRNVAHQKYCSEPDCRKVNWCAASRLRKFSESSSQAQPKKWRGQHAKGKSLRLGGILLFPPSTEVGTVTATFEIETYLAIPKDRC